MILVPLTVSTATPHCCHESNLCIWMQWWPDDSLIDQIINPFLARSMMFLMALTTSAYSLRESELTDKYNLIIFLAICGMWLLVSWQMAFRYSSAHAMAQLPAGPLFSLISILLLKFALTYQISSPLWLSLVQKLPLISTHSNGPLWKNANTLLQAFNLLMSQQLNTFSYTCIPYHAMVIWSWL